VTGVKAFGFALAAEVIICACDTFVAKSFNGLIAAVTNDSRVDFADGVGLWGNDLR
jgi:hypothetical protein